MTEGYTTGPAELRQVGLLDGGDEPHLTAKGRVWLKMLERAETQEAYEDGGAAEDLILSTSGLFR